MKCDLCNIYCPSSYQWDQHVRGRKHAEKLQGKTPSTKGRGGVCFYWEKGNCYKGSACTFLHSSIRESGGTTTFSSGKKREFPYCEPTSSNLITPYKTSETNDNDDDFVADILLCKGEKDDDDDDDPDSKLAPIFRKKKKPPTTPGIKESSRFPEIYRNAFHRKKNVNLYIREDVGVVFEFAYNTTIIEAVKTQIKGRAWNPAMKCWTCPLESLPDAIALYEHMGRQVDESLKKRASDLTQSLGSAADTIQLSIQLQKNSNGEISQSDTTTTTTTTTTTPNENTITRVGSVSVKFLYTADIVASLKKISPPQRSYDPAKKIWTIDLLALPELMEHLRPLGYAPNQQLSDLAKSCSKFQDLFWRALSSKKDGEEEEEEEEQAGKDNDDDDDDDDDLEAGLKELIQLVNQTKGSADTQVDRSNCGQAKRRKLLTTSQRRWGRNKSSSGWDPNDGGYYDSEEDYDDDDDDFSRFSTLLRRERRYYRKTKPPADCDCGQPWRITGGRHVCRYFGTFECENCSNRWTSAYCWKSEKQACRSCNRENLPIQTEQLDGRPPVAAGGGGGHHDSARCAMCRRLGYNCSL